MASKLAGQCWQPGGRPALPGSYNWSNNQSMGCMGEAKRRGSHETRKEQAVTTLRSRFPNFVNCNQCQAELSEINPLDTRAMPGLHLAGIAHCSACEHETFILDGEPRALAAFQEYITSEHGDEVSSGVALKPT